ncbi:hypothetical protein K438DRAFT_1931792 [Mycena galopus ATCC 62051]|nr:hypothetical protein K438DRAFT_1931792 [Mycena galopus ATCC 62051]
MALGDSRKTLTRPNEIPQGLTLSVLVLQRSMISMEESQFYPLPSLTAVPWVHEMSKYHCLHPMANCIETATECKHRKTLLHSARTARDEGVKKAFRCSKTVCSYMSTNLYLGLIFNFPDFHSYTANLCTSLRFTRGKGIPLEVHFHLTKGPIFIPILQNHAQKVPQDLLIMCPKQLCDKPLQNLVEGCKERYKGIPLQYLWQAFAVAGYYWGIIACGCHIQGVRLVIFSQLVARPIAHSAHCERWWRDVHSEAIQSHSAQTAEFRAQNSASNDKILSDMQQIRRDRMGSAFVHGSRVGRWVELVEPEVLHNLIHPEPRSIAFPEFPSGFWLFLSDKPCFVLERPTASICENRTVPTSSVGANLLQCGTIAKQS